MSRQRITNRRCDRGGGGGESYRDWGESYRDGGGESYRDWGESYRDGGGNPTGIGGNPTGIQPNFPFKINVLRAPKVFCYF